MFVNATRLHAAITSSLYCFLPTYRIIQRVSRMLSVCWRCSPCFKCRRFHWLQICAQAISLFCMPAGRRVPENRIFQTSRQARDTRRRTNADGKVVSDFVPNKCAPFNSARNVSWEILNKNLALFEFDVLVNMSISIFASFKLAKKQKRVERGSKSLSYSIGLATKWVRILSLGGVGKIRNHLITNPIRSVILWKEWFFFMVHSLWFYNTDSIKYGAHGMLNWLKILRALCQHKYHIYI